MHARKSGADAVPALGCRVRSTKYFFRGDGRRRGARLRSDVASAMQLRGDP